MKPLRWILGVGFIAYAISLATLAGEAAAAVPWENGEPPILLGAEVEAPCSYCTSLSGTIVGPADGLAFQAASSP